MWKIKFFLLVEAILGVLALVTMLTDDLSRVLILLILFLLLLYYYRGEQRNNFLLVAAFALFFFVTMFNPFVIAGIVFAVVYGFFLFSPYLQREREATVLHFKEMASPAEKNRWWGDIHHFSQDRCQFDDINLVHLSGRDTIHLEEVVLTNHDNVILLRKLFGDTKIIVPVDVAVSLQVNSLYGQVNFFEEESVFLRNEYLTKKSWDYERANKSVKIVVSGLIGNIEVVRA